MNYAKSILQNILSLRFEQITGGLYTSDFDDIEISYTNRSLLIKNLLLMPYNQDNKESDTPQVNGEQDVLSLFIPEIRISGINLRKAYFQNKLEIGSILLEKPDIKLNINFDDSSGNNSLSISKNLQDILPAGMEQLSVRTVRINDGVIKLQAKKNNEENHIQISPFQFELSNFLAGSGTGKSNDEIFSAEEFFMEADSITGFLAAKKYRLNVESLKISSADSSAFARNIRLTPLKSTEEFAQDSSLSNIYRVDFPRVYIYGLSLIDFFEHRDLIAGEVTILNPSLELINLRSLDPGQKESFKLENLYPVIDKVLRSVKVENLTLRNGEVQIYVNRDGLQEKLASGIQLANIRNFVLDSAAGKNEQKILYSDRINFTLNNYSLRLSDNLHLLQAKELFFSSDKSEIRALDFLIKPDTINKSSDNSRIMFSASVPSIRLNGADMLKAYNENILEIDSIRLQQPSFTLLRQDKKATPTLSGAGKGFKEEDLYALIEDYLYSLSIDKISLQKGMINIKNNKRKDTEAFITNIRKASLWKFRLDSASAYEMNKLFYANDFELEIENYNHLLPDDLHRITANEIGISTLKDNIYISDLKIVAEGNQYPYPELQLSNAKTLLNLHVPLLELEEVDILKAYLQKHLEVGSVRIPSPAIQLGTLLESGTSERTDIIKSSAIYDLMSGFLEVIKVQKLLLQDGRLDLAFYAKQAPLIVSGRRTEIQVDNFRFDSLTSSNPKRLFFADNVKVKAEDYSTYLPDGIHVISAKNLYASTEEQNIMAEEVTVKTAESFYNEEELLKKQGQKGYFNLILPKINLTGINFDSAYYLEHLKIDSVLAQKPEVRYTFVINSDGNEKDKKKKKVNLQPTGFYQAISPYFEALEINSLVMENGMFSAVQLENGNYIESTLLQGINLQMDKYLADSISAFDSERFLFADDIRIQIDRYQQELLDKIHTLSARNLELSTALRQVKAHEIRLKPDSKKLQQFSTLISTSYKNRYNIHLPELEINGIGFNEVYSNGKLEIDELLLQYPEIQIRHHTQEPDRQEKAANKQSLVNYDFYELIRGNLQSLEINNARVINGQGMYTRVSAMNTSFRIKTDRFDSHIKNFKIGEKHKNKDKLFNADDVSISLTGFERKLPDSLHIFNIDELNISTRENKIEFRGAQLQPRNDIQLISQLKSKGVDKLFYIKIPFGKFSGLDSQLIEKDSLIFQSILIKNAGVNIYHYPHFSQTQSTKKEESIHWSEPLLKNLNIVQSQAIQLEEAKLTFTTISEEQDSSSFYIGNIDGVVANFKIDSVEIKKRNRIFFSDRIQGRIKDYSAKLDNGLYMFKINSILLDTRDGNIMADSVSLTPLADRKTFANIKGYETDQFTLRNRSLKIIKLDYKALLDGNFFADSLLLDGFALHVYRDKRQPYPQNHFPEMPQEIIRKLDSKVMLLGMAIRNGYIGYEEQARGARGTGFIDLTNLNIISDTISNDPTLLAQGLTTNIRMECLLMGTGHLEAFFKIPLGDSLNSHTFYGRLDEMSLSDFNPILEKSVSIKIRSGHAHQINFYVEADKHLAKGNMDFKYSDLKVALVNKRTGKTGGPVKEIGSLLANWLVVNTNNTGEEDKPFKKGEIRFERDNRRSTVNYWVKTLVNGFKSSIGL